MSKRDMPMTVCVDFDGTIARWNHGQGYGPGTERMGAPVPGVAEALKRLKVNGWHIIIHTCRGEKGYADIEKYMQQNGIPFDEINKNRYQLPDMNPGKPVADVYVDDRAIDFKGDWKDALRQVVNFRPWYENHIEVKE
jgi:hypothetical protein